MTQTRILQLAYYQALALWMNEKEKLDEMPNNEFQKARERKYRAEYDEISQMLYDAEQKEKENA